MSERREFWISPSGVARTREPASFTSDGFVLAREVLPGDLSTVGWNAYKDLHAQHAALVEVATAFADWGQGEIAGASEQQRRHYHADYLALRKVLERIRT